MKRFSTCCCSGCEIRINLSPEGINLTNVDVKSKLIGLYNPLGDLYLFWMLLSNVLRTQDLTLLLRCVVGLAVGWMEERYGRHVLVLLEEARWKAVIPTRALGLQNWEPDPGSLSQICLPGLRHRCGQSLWSWFVSGNWRFMGDSLPRRKQRAPLIR